MIQSENAESKIQFKPLSGRDYPRFSSIKTFFRLPNLSFDQALVSKMDVGIFGIPYDGGTSYRPGSRFAPSQVREVSSLGRSFHWTRGLNVFEALNVADLGDCPTVPIDQKQTYALIEKYIDQLLSHNKKTIAVGGDHSITLPILRSFHKKFGKLNLIHFDAHLDTYPAAWNCEYHHGAFARHAIEEGLVDPKSMLQIGIRGPLTSAQDLDFIKKHQINVTTMDDLRNHGLEKFIASLPEFKGPTYISFDIDCLDPAFAPGTGTPVPGGMTTYEMQRILRGLKISNLLGGDLVEICPSYDPAQITSLAGVEVCFELISHMAISKGK